MFKFYQSTLNTRLDPKRTTKIHSVSMMINIQFHFIYGIRLYRSLIVCCIYFVNVCLKSFDYHYYRACIGVCQVWKEEKPTAISTRPHPLSLSLDNTCTVPLRNIRFVPTTMRHNGRNRIYSTSSAFNHRGTDLPFRLGAVQQPVQLA